MDRDRIVSVPGVRWVARVQILVILVFFPAKAFRPRILAANAPEFVDIFFLSFPNFCEGIVGVATLTALGSFLRERSLPKLRTQTIYLGAVGLAAVYVFTQELRIHNLGGNNVYDPHDMVASLLGLLGGLALLMWQDPLSRRTDPDTPVASP